MEVDVSRGDNVMRISDIRLVRGRLDNPYLLTWILEGKVGNEWEYLTMVTPDREEKILKYLKVFREADYYYRCTKEIPVVQIERDREIVLEEKVAKWVNEKNLWDKYWRG